MQPIYRFFLQIGDGGNKVAVTPVYKDDLALDYELETNQYFYRAKLSGKISFVRTDYDLIIGADFEATYYLYIEKSNDFGLTWTQYYKAQFFRTDCTINVDDKMITVQPETIDQYNDVIAGLEKEYNLIELAPEINKVVLTKRPLIQIYIPGDSIVSCFLGGMAWEQDANVTEDQNALVKKYYFSLGNILKTIEVTNINGSIDASGIYAGRLQREQTDTVTKYSGILRPETANGFHISVVQQNREVWENRNAWIADVSILRDSDNAVLYTFSQIQEAVFNNKEFDMNPPKHNAITTGSMHAYMFSHNIYSRYLLDVDTLLDVQTYDLSADDIVDNNRNYRKVIGYAFDIAYTSLKFSNEPTEYGRADDGRYYLPPGKLSGQKFYPIARTTWGYSSLWFAFDLLDDIVEDDARKKYILRDAYPIASCINVLLQKIAPGITHQATAEYSQFLYGSNNPVGGEHFNLLCAQKSNILAGDYQTPAQKAPTTLRQFTDMLKNVFQCYWYIVDGKFKIEHVSWFRNGGSYGSSAKVGTDLTKLINVRNGKPWAYGTSEYTYDKEDMPERYEFEWMDDVTTPFQGLPINVLSKFVQAGKIEDITISDFTSDIDLMLLNPGGMSQDGFALLSAVPGNAMKIEQGVFPTTVTAKNGDTDTYALDPLYGGRACIFTLTAIQKSPTESGDAAWIGFFFYKDGKQMSGSSVATLFTSDQRQQITLTIPEGADAVGWYVGGEAVITLWSVTCNDLQELPFFTYEVEGVEYRLQNGYLAMVYLQPKYWLYDMPSMRVEVNGEETEVSGVQRKKKQTLNFPSGDNDPDTLQLVKTDVGNAQVGKLSINLHSRMIKATLNYDTTT